MDHSAPTLFHLLLTPARVESGAETSAPRVSVAGAYILYVTASERSGSEVYAPLYTLAHARVRRVCALYIRKRVAVHARIVVFIGKKTQDIVVFAGRFLPPKQFLKKVRKFRKKRKKLIDNPLFSCYDIEVIAQKAVASETSKQNRLCKD